MLEMMTSSRWAGTATGAMGGEADELPFARHSAHAARAFGCECGIAEEERLAWERLIRRARARD